MTILSFSLIPAAAGPDMETWIAFSLNNSGAELSISKQKDRKIEREGERGRWGKRERGKEREGGSWKLLEEWGREKRKERKRHRR